MIFNKINSDNKNYPLELSLGLEALKKVLKSKNFEVGKEIHVNSWMRLIPQAGKKGVEIVDSEVHARYHDIFFLAKGRELTVFQGHMSFEEANEKFGPARSGKFDEAKDIGFVQLDRSVNAVWNVLDREHFAYYAPGDYHASQISMAPNEEVVKLVVKILDKKYLTQEMLSDFEADLQNL